MYKPKYKPNQLICGSGQTAIVTGWTVKEFVAKNLSPDQYAVVGSLYSPTRGISPLIRNLLLNPQVTDIIILNATKEDKNSGGCRCLSDFFVEGATRGISDTSKDCWVINSNITGYIDGEISEEALRVLKIAIRHFDAKSIQELKGYLDYIEQHPNSIKMPRQVLDFPDVEVLPIVLPGPRYGHRIEGKTIAETWVKILQRIKTTGTIRPTGYDNKWQELIDLMAIVTDEPIDFYFPVPNYLPIDREFLNAYIPQILDDAPKQEGVKYTYGQRLRSWFGQDQIELCIEKLIKEIDAASAVMSLWDVQDHLKGGSPCLNHIWVRVVEDELSLTAIFRSNDMFSAWPANAMGLRALQKHILEEINKRSDYALTMGPLITISQSAHIYEDTWDNVDKIINNQYQGIIKITYDDPVGAFLIEIENDQIVVNQTTTGGGEIVATYSSKHPLKLIREIAVNIPAITPAHIGYLGIELQKAYTCLKTNQIYFQDKDLTYNLTKK